MKKIAVPTCNLPKSTILKQICFIKSAQAEARKRRTIKRATQVVKRIDFSSEESKVTIDNVNDDDGFNIYDTLKANTFQPETNDVSIQVTTGDFKIPLLLSFIDNDIKLSTLTGIHSYELHNSIIECLQLSQLVPYRKLQTFSLEERVVMTLMKLKQNMSYSVLAILFNCSSTNCKRIVFNTIYMLSIILKSMIPWPSRNEINSNMPLCFKHYSDTRIIVDCIEIPLMKPKNLSSSIITYSQYKSTYTAKFMTGITPGGILSFITPAYGGRASDKFIFENSKLIDKLEAGDAIMADKGFLIDNVCAQRHIKLYRPTFLKVKTQLSKDEALLNVTIASARVHIERVNQRMKVFSVFQKFPSSLISKLDAIFLIISAIVNLSQPILADDKFVSDNSNLDFSVEMS